MSAVGWVLGPAFPSERTNIATGEVTEYAWDHRNRLVEVIERTGDGGPIVQSVEYVYDSQNRWIAKSLDPDGDTNILWPLTDHLNTVRDLAVYNPETTVTTIANRLVYDAFGQVTSQTNPTITTLFDFTARPFDSATNLQNNLNRWYDAGTGAWLSQDPIGFAAADANLYRYVGNNPPNAIDATGLASTTVDAGFKGIRFFIEWFPGKNTGEIAIIGRKGVQLARVKWILNPKTGELVANVVAKHGGKILPGVARSSLKKIMPLLTKEMAKNAERIGGTWVLTRLANPAKTGGRVGLARVAGKAGFGTMFAVVLAFFSLENTCQAAEIERPEVMEIDPAALGLTPEEIAALVEALEADLPDHVRAYLDEE